MIPKLNFLERKALETKSLVALQGLLKTRKERNLFLANERRAYEEKIKPGSLFDFNHELRDLIEAKRVENWEAVKYLTKELELLFKYQIN
jgi:RNA polymerase-interacting CarD/CdnL/TRCF family regulator